MTPDASGRGTDESIVRTQPAAGSGWPVGDDPVDVGELREPGGVFEALPRLVPMCDFDPLLNRDEPLGRIGHAEHGATRRG